MLRQSGKLQRQETVNECLGCQAPGPRQDWLTIVMEAAQGPRGVGNTWSLQSTIATNIVICPKCLFGPAFEMIRRIINHPLAVTGVPDYDHYCVVLCRNGAAGYNSSGPRRRRVTCPRCWRRRRAVVWDVAREIPVAIRSLWWDTTTEPEQGDMSSELETVTEDTA